MLLSQILTDIRRQKIIQIILIIKYYRFLLNTRNKYLCKIAKNIPHRF